MRRPVLECSLSLRLFGLCVSCAADERSRSSVGEPFLLWEVGGPRVVPTSEDVVRAPTPAVPAMCFDEPDREGPFAQLIDTRRTVPRDGGSVRSFFIKRRSVSSSTLQACVVSPIHPRDRAMTAPSAIDLQHVSEWKGEKRLGAMHFSLRVGC
jgi:hypothetical protein